MEVLPTGWMTASEWLTQVCVCVFSTVLLLLPPVCRYFQGGGGPTSVMNKLRYATQVKARPPTFAFFLSGGKGNRRRTRNKKAGNRKAPKDLVPNSVEKYLRNEIRSAFGLQGIPVRVMFK